ncbi:MAG: Ig-like domain-containing protein [Bacteroidales bacterium]|nr:Ig-like domain-containing protein [Bacteroidales bacterium]MCF8455710.1 Ig-like domain-containing protein [Bacteroidales bacterium]
MKTKGKRLWMTTITSLLLMAVVIGGCKKDNYVEVDGVCPVVISTDPINAALGVPLDQIISATFNEKMNPATINQGSFTLIGTTKNVLQGISGSLTYNEANATMSFVPDTFLTANTTYSGRVESSIKDLMGNALQTDHVWTFTTGTTLSPMVISTDPVNNATGVFLNKVVFASFNIPMDPLTINDTTFTLKQGTTLIAGAVSYYGMAASFTTALELTPNTIYTGSITTDVKDISGNPLEVTYVWTFTTGNVVAPKVISTEPAYNETGVALNKIVTATFSVPMDPLTINGTNFKVKQGTISVAGAINYAGTTAFFIPSSALTSNTMYTCAISTGAKNIAGTPLVNDYLWTFTTGSILAPSVISTDPVNNETSVAITKIVTATFNEPMDPLSVTPTTFLLKQGTNLVEGFISYTNSNATFVPTFALTPSAIYTCTITTGVKNVAGIPLANNYIWSFTTQSLSDPLVIYTDPLNNAQNVPLNQVVTASFNMPMALLTINSSTFTLSDGSSLITGIVSYTGTTASFTPSGDLDPGTTYTGTITTGAESTTSMPLVNNYEWTFTTISNVAPLVILTDPANNDTEVPLNKTVTTDFDMEMDALTISSATFTLFDGVNLVTGTVSYTGTMASFIPTGGLLSGITYTATITTGATNLGGIPLAVDYEWSFSTQTIVVPPTVDLGSASIFGAFGGNAGITNQGLNTVINGAISTTAASTLVTGFHDGLTSDVYTETPLNVGLVTDGIFTAPPFPGTATSEAIATQGLIDATAAYLSISPASMPGGIDPGSGELGGLTLYPGVYKSASGTFNISNGPLTLDAQGDPNATWVFQTAAGLTVGIAGPTGARSVLLVNGGLPKNVFWYVGSSATINGAGGGVVVGTIIANSGVTFSTPGNTVQTVLNGRAISLIASVTVVNTTINVPAP